MELELHGRVTAAPRPLYFAQAAFQRAKHVQVGKLGGSPAGFSQSRRQPEAQQEQQGNLSPRHPLQHDSKQKRRGTVAVPPLKTLGGWQPAAAQASGKAPSVCSQSNTTSATHAAVTRSTTPPGQRRLSFPPSGSKTARELNDALLQQQQQQHHQQLLARSAELPCLHLLLQTPETYRQKDRGVSLRGMAAAMQASFCMFFASWIGTYIFAMQS